MRETTSNRTLAIFSEISDIIVLVAVAAYPRRRIAYTIGRIS